MQRRLTKEELDEVAEVKDRLFKWIGDSSGDDVLRAAYHKLSAMFLRATSDGKHWDGTESTTRRDTMASSIAAQIEGGGYPRQD